MKRILVLCFLVGATRIASAQSNLLTNGNFETGSGTVYFDGSDSTVADDEPGWLASLSAADGSYVLISPEFSDPAAGTRDLDMGIGPSGGGIQTAAGSRPAVTPLSIYRATVTTDNYFAPSGAAYFIDWFDAGGSLISSIGGPLVDPAPLTYAPYTQLFSVLGAAPVNAASAGVRFTSGNPGYSGLAADNFTLSQVPEPAAGVIVLAIAIGFRTLICGRKES
jgi:hypothetical protein